MKLSNDENTPVDVIKSQMNEPRPLPMGRKDFDEWSERIISGSLVPGATMESQKFALASMLTHLGPTESHKPDAYYIHALRVGAIKQVAIDVLTEMKNAQKAKLEAEKPKEDAKLMQEVNIGGSVGKILIPAPTTKARRPFWQFFMRSKAST